MDTTNPVLTMQLHDALIEIPLPCYVPDMANDVYHGLKAFTSSTQIKRYGDTVPAKIHYDETYPPERDESAYALGTLVHTLVLEPHMAANTVAVAPDVNKRTKDGRATLDKFYKDNAGKTIVDEIQYEQALLMAQAIKDDPTAARLLNGTVNEYSVFWEHESGELLKVRFDAANPYYKLLVDIKTTQVASWDEFQRTILKYGYHISAAMYLHGVNACTDLLADLDVDGFEGFAFICVEKEPPYCVACYELSPDFLAIGAGEFDANLDRMITAKATQYPGYTNALRVITPPPWAGKLKTI